MEIGRMIQLERKKKGWTQKELCSGICAVSYLSLVENGKILPNEEVVALLVDRLGIDSKPVTTNEFNSIRASLYEWLNAIRKRDFKSSQDLKINFQKKYNTHFYDPTLQAEYLLILLRHKVLHTDLKEIGNILDRLDKLRLYLHNTTLIAYYHTLGHYEYEQGSPEKSITLLNRAMKLSKELNVYEPDLYYHLALVYLKLQDSPNTLIHADLALGQFQKEYNFKRIIDCNLLKGIANRKIGNFEEAQFIFENLLSYNLSLEQEGQVLHNFGHLYYKLGDYTNAISMLKKAIEVKKGDSAKAISYYLLGKVYVDANDINEAEEILLIGNKLINKEELNSLSIKFKLLEYQVTKTEQSSQYVEFVLDKAIPFFEEHEIDYAKKYLIKIASHYENKRCYKEANQLLRRALKL